MQDGVRPFWAYFRCCGVKMGEEVIRDVRPCGACVRTPGVVHAVSRGQERSVAQDAGGMRSRFGGAWWRGGRPEAGGQRGKAGGNKGGRRM